MVELNGLQVNVAAVVVATATGVILGLAWYGKLFARPWMVAMGYDHRRRP